MFSKESLLPKIKNFNLTLWLIFIILASIFLGKGKQFSCVGLILGKEGGIEVLAGNINTKKI